MQLLDIATPSLWDTINYEYENIILLVLSIFILTIAIYFIIKLRKNGINTSKQDNSQQ
jgi:hypothetical protein